MIKVRHVTPILNVSDMTRSFDWFGKLGWEKEWDWGDPPTFGCVGNGDAGIFLCLGGQGSRGPELVGEPWGDDQGGAWMTWWLETPAAVDAAYQLALGHGMTVSLAPADMPWNVREFHLRHPDGHTFRVTASLPEE